MSNSPESTGGGPFSEQREIYELLSQETRHLVLQYILAHPKHLLSLDELAYLIPKNKAAIRDQVQRLQSEGIIDRYDYPPNEDSRDLPWQFYGLTEHGLDILEEYNYLRGLPVARALYDNTRLSEKAERHRDAPRPDLPESVEQALRIDDEEESADVQRLVNYIQQRKGGTRSLDDQLKLMRAFYRKEIGPSHEGITQKEIQTELDLDLQYRLRTLTEHLVEIGILEKVEPRGPDVFAISEQRDEIVLGQIEKEAERNIDALIEHIDDQLQILQLNEGAAELSAKDAVDAEPSVALADGAGRTIRSILAEEFDVVPESVTKFLKSGDTVSRLNAAVDAIESSDEVKKSKEFGRILFVKPAYRYRLSKTAIELL